MNLIDIAKMNRGRYESASPFPHIILHDVFDDNLKLMNRDWPGDDDVKWFYSKKGDETQKLKRGTADIQNFKMTIRDFINMLNGEEFLLFLETLTGITGLIADTRLVGGGLHETFPGGKLNIHADFNKHPITNLDRRLNVLIYLNEGWTKEQGGFFELWDENMERSIQVLPAMNCMAIFSTTSTSYHGNPVEVKGNKPRRSIALYYYTNGRPANEVNRSHTTIFKVRRGNKQDKRDRIKLIAKKFIPPITYDFAKHIRFLLFKK